MDVSKTKSSFYRRLYVAYLIEFLSQARAIGMNPPNFAFYVAMRTLALEPPVDSAFQSRKRLA